MMRNAGKRSAPVRDGAQRGTSQTDLQALTGRDRGFWRGRWFSFKAAIAGAVHTVRTQPNAWIELAELFVGSLRIKEMPHLKVFRRDLVGCQRLRVSVKLTLRVFPRDQIQFVFDT